MTKTEKIAEQLQKMFPKIHGIRTCEQWNGNAKQIHLGDAAEGGVVDFDGQEIPAADYYSYERDPLEHYYRADVSIPLYEAVKALGYTLEWYDPGTLLAYRIE